MIIDHRLVTKVDKIVVTNREASKGTVRGRQ